MKVTDEMVEAAQRYLGMPYGPKCTNHCRMILEAALSGVPEKVPGPLSEVQLIALREASQHFYHRGADVYSSAIDGVISRFPTAQRTPEELGKLARNRNIADDHREKAIDELVQRAK